PYRIHYTYIPAPNTQGVSQVTLFSFPRCLSKSHSETPSKTLLSLLVTTIWITITLLRVNFTTRY
ncbi:hypothetical protein BOTBODRAFT_69170, partial [Botryobasidium botryosum FD-172 SS1]